MAGKGGIRDKTSKGKKGRGKGDRTGKTRGVPICDLSNHQLKSTLMVPERGEENRETRCEHILK